MRELERDLRSLELDLQISLMLGREPSVLWTNVYIQAEYGEVFGFYIGQAILTISFWGIDGSRDTKRSQVEM